MTDREIRDDEEARRFLLQGLWLQRLVPLHPESVPLVLGWVLELAAAGHPVPPVGFVADVGHLAFGLDRGASSVRAQPPLPIVGWSEGVAWTYEDLVLGKLYGDWSFERASEALGRLRGRDRARGLAFLLEQARRRAGFGGVVLNPSAIKRVLDQPPTDAIARGWELLGEEGPDPDLIALYDDLIGRVRNVADLLGREDVFELEHGTALAGFAQRLALRQVLQVASEFDDVLERSWPRPPARRLDVPTRVLDEDTYPVGGFSSIATRGSVESLLHSQLAYMEPGVEERPDLFDIKFLRDELLYYARDENQFLRQRRTYVFVLYPDLVRSRIKDAELPRQRVVLLLGLLVAAVRKLTEWLSHDALSFEFVFLLEEGEPLGPECALVEMIFRDAIASGTVVSTTLLDTRVVARCEARAARSLCHVLAIAAIDRRIEAGSTLDARVRIDGPRPWVALGDEELTIPEADDALSSWEALLDRLLPHWV